MYRSEHVVRHCGLREITKLAATSREWREYPEIARVVATLDRALKGGEPIADLNMFVVGSGIKPPMECAQAREVRIEPLIYRTIALFAREGLHEVALSLFPSGAYRGARVLTRCGYVFNETVYYAALELGALIRGDYPRDHKPFPKKAIIPAAFLSVAVTAVITGCAVARHFEFINSIVADKRPSVEFLAKTWVTALYNAPIDHRAPGLSEFMECLIARDFAGAREYMPQLSIAAISRLINGHCDVTTEFLNHSVGFAIGPLFARVMLDNRRIAPILGTYPANSELFAQAITILRGMPEVIHHRRSSPRDIDIISMVLSRAAINPDDRALDVVHDMLVDESAAPVTCSIFWRPDEGLAALQRAVRRIEAKGMTAIFFDVIAHSDKQSVCLPRSDEVVRILDIILARASHSIINGSDAAKQTIKVFLARYAAAFRDDVMRGIRAHFASAPRLISLIVERADL